MLTPREELTSFQQFAEEKLAIGGSALPLDELFTEWHDRQYRDEISAAIRRGLADVEEGRYRAAGDAMEMIRQEFSF